MLVFQKFSCSSWSSFLWFLCSGCAHSHIRPVIFKESVSDSWVMLLIPLQIWLHFILICWVGGLWHMWIIQTLRRITLHECWQWCVPWAFTFKNSAFCPYSVQLCIVYSSQNSWWIHQRVLILVGCDTVLLVHWCRSSRSLLSAHLKMIELRSFEMSC